MAAVGTPAPAQDRKVQDVEVYQGDFATVNSFLFSNGTSLLVLDVQRKPKEARELIERIKARHLPLAYILISHGHTDHFTGMALLKQAFPGARIVVANENIKRAIKAYAVYMDRGGQTGAEPALDRSIKPKSAEYPGGFDYQAEVEALNRGSITLPGGGTLKLTTDYKRAEAAYMTTVYSPDLNALFLADFGYNGVHHWMGDDISWQDIANWREELGRIKHRYAAIKPRVYPGHGDPTDMRLFDAMIRYIDDFTRIVRHATSREQAMREMVARYPDYQQADFFLKYSLENHLKPH